METLNYYMEHIKDILTYNGNTYDIQMNYGMLLLALCCWCFTVLRVFKTIPDFCAFTAASLYLLFTVQIACCLLVHCVGISGVWCALIGFAYRLWVHSPSDPVVANRVLVWATFVCYLWANVHYFRTETSIFTTICHLIATWLGYEANNIWVKTHEKREEKQQKRK